MWTLHILSLLHRQNDIYIYILILVLVELIMAPFFFLQHGSTIAPISPLWLPLHHHALASSHLRNRL
jgi:hypothetical protein